jgi:hypothetical protein
MESKSCGVLDTPLEPVIGLAEGETRWRSMTVFVRSDATLNSDSVIPGCASAPDPESRDSGHVSFVAVYFLNCS